MQNLKNMQQVWINNYKWIVNMKDISFRLLCAEHVAKNYFNVEILITNAYFSETSSNGHLLIVDACI